MLDRVFQEQLAYGQHWEDRAKELIKQLNDGEVIEQQTAENYKTTHYDV